MQPDRPSEMVSVVMPTFNRRDSLEQVVQPLLGDPSTGEVVLVVDGCDDGTFEFLRDWAVTEPRIRPIYQENSGEAAARQRGAEEARFEVLVVLDDDVTAGAGLVTGHAHHHIDRAKRMVVGYMPTKVSSPRSLNQVSTVLYARDYEATCEDYERNPESILTHLWAGNLSMRRAEALKIGFVRTPALRYHADMDFGIRCQIAGWEAVFDRSLRATHSHSRSLDQFAAECRRSGQARASLVHEFPSFASAIDPLGALTAKQKLVVNLLASPTIRPLSSTLTRCAARTAEQLGMWELELISARLMRQVELQSSFKSTLSALTTKAQTRSTE